MNVLLLSSSDIEGGAARAAYRLHQGLRSVQINSQMLVQVKFSDDVDTSAPPPNLRRDFAKVRPAIDSLPLKFYPHRVRTAFSCQWLPNRLTARVRQYQPDILNLHWVCDGYLPIEAISRFSQPLVWTLHDMWAFTGGCHYSQDCTRYTAACGACPQLGSTKECDLSRWIWRRKAQAWRSLNLTVVTPSQWLAKCARSSYLLKDSRVEVIPNGIDLAIYRPIDRNTARNLLKLPQHKQLVLTGAMNAGSDPRKGIHLLQAALQNLSQDGWHDRIELVVFGAKQPQEPMNLGVQVHYLGRLSDDLSLALVYGAVDVFVAPSLQDNLPNTVIEALACGIPCVAFRIGGMPDLIEHYTHGYLAQPFDIDDLARGIGWVLDSQERHQKLSLNACTKAKTAFPLDLQARRYTALFEELLQAHPYPQI